MSRHGTNDDPCGVERRLQALVRSWGLSRFSEHVAAQWLARALASSPDALASADTACTSVDGADALARLRAWLLLQLNGQRLPPDVSPWQRGCPELLPLLRAQPTWTTARLPCVAALERAFPAIKRELLALRGQPRGFQPYRAPSWASDRSAKDGLGSLGHDTGDWNVFYLFLHNVDFAAHRALCPETAAAIAAIGAHYDHAFFSALAPRTHVARHHGPTNKKLRCHLPLVVPPHGACRLRVGDRMIDVREGECFVFDDSFEHEAWNDDAAHSRIVLVVDVWHPDLSAPERKFLAFLRDAQLRMAKKRSADAPDSFYAIITEASNQDFSTDEAVWS
ncbi:hypothetical protein PybrP1_012336 [[Pythium] brassicae (nom. inval.)]|nr:hypothetical protein PybrP1_012336 [[Pythium] brassicae (nom. inval.)]